MSDVTGRKVATVAADKSFAAGRLRSDLAAGAAMWPPVSTLLTLYSGKTMVQSVREFERQLSSTLAAEIRAAGWS
ncbi:MAG: hypothetical protein WKG07_16485 [Hymenobacter sp.]